MASTNVLVMLAMTQYEKARARLTSLVGQFFTYRERLLKMRDRADYLARKAEKTGNAALIEAVRQLTPRIDQAFNKQVALEGSVQGALSQISAVQAGQATDAGATAQPTSIFATAATLVKTAASIAVHQKGVAALESVLKTIESRSLTAAEAAQLRAGGGMGASFGAIAAVGIGAVALVFLAMKGRKR